MHKSVYKSAQAKQWSHLQLVKLHLNLLTPLPIGLVQTTTYEYIDLTERDGDVNDKLSLIILCFTDIIFPCAHGKIPCTP